VIGGVDGEVVNVDGKLIVDEMMMVVGEMVVDWKMYF